MTVRTGRCSRRSIWAATWGAAHGSWIRTSSAPAGTSTCRRTRAQPHGTWPRAGPSTHAARREPGGHLPELAALGLGSLACAALARRAGRRRRIGARLTEDLDIGPVLSEGAQDAAALLGHFAGVPALHSFEAANCLLGLSLHGRTDGPRVRAICVSPSGVTFCLADGEPGASPEGFVREVDGTAWHVEHGALGGHDPGLPYLPVVLPIGDDADGTWLIPLEPGDVLPLLGEGAPALWRAARAAAGSWAWSETILVTEDPEDPRLRTEVAADRWRDVSSSAATLSRSRRERHHAAPSSRWRPSPPAT